MLRDVYGNRHACHAQPAQTRLGAPFHCTTGSGTLTLSLSTEEDGYPFSCGVKFAGHPEQTIGIQVALPTLTPRNQLVRPFRNPVTIIPGNSDFGYVHKRDSTTLNITSGTLTGVQP
jgi:hypothetical protein